MKYKKEFKTRRKEVSPNYQRIGGIITNKQKTS